MSIELSIDKSVLCPLCGKPTELVLVMCELWRKYMDMTYYCPTPDCDKVYIIGRHYFG